MEFIDKNKGQQDADNILNDFMTLHQSKDAQGNPEKGRYENVNYDALSKDTMVFKGKTDSHKEHLTTVLRYTQEDSRGAQHCCYCMRRINDEEVTLEHIIQHSLDSNDRNQYQRYIDYRLPFLTDKNVILACDYRAKFNAAGQYVPPYPHVMAYHNLVASCYGYFPKKENREQQLIVCCNNKRSDEHIYPLFYDIEWRQKVEYGANGWMVAIYQGDNTDIKSGLVNLATKVGLNTTPLIEIRHLWFVMRKENIAVLQAIQTKAERRAKLYEVLQLGTGNASESDRLLRKKYSTDDYWALFMKYDWFWEYYRQKYP